jgi:long-chain fatty acid transport protein
MRRSLVMAGAALAACAAGGTSLHAQGSAVDQHSACMTGRVGAGVASPCDDGSAVFFSPAALASQSGAASLGAILVRSNNVFRYDSTATPPGQTIERETESIVVPQGYITYRVRENIGVGVGVFAPYGLGLKWPVCEVEEPNCTGPNFEGRYTGYDNALRGIYIQPTVAVQVIPDRLSIGVGLDYVMGSITVNQRADAPQLGLQGRDVADAKLEGSGTAITGHVGVQLRLSESTSIGARYLHSAKVDLDGDATFRQVSVSPVVDPLLAPQFVEGGPLGDQGISSELEFPWHWVVGISHRPTERLNLLLDFQRTGWSTFDELVIDFENATAADRTLALGYRDANTVRFGADYQASDALALRAGFRYNTAATPRATPLLPEGERNYYTLGLGYHFTQALSADFALQHIVQPDRRGAVRPGAGTVGIYESNAKVLAFTLAYRFGGGSR